jgi:nucleotide-binding universal stress UspA family protein
VHAPCSVLVVRPGKSLGDKNEALKICVAFDDSEPSRNAIRHLKSFEWRQNSQFHVVHVMTMPYMFSDIPIAIDTNEVRDASRKIVEGSAEDFRNVSDQVVFHVLESGHIGDAIARFAEKNDCDLVVMGDTGRGMLDRFLVGSASRYTIRHAPCSVWVVRNKAVRG